MSLLNKPIRQAQRRLWTQRWFTQLCLMINVAAGLFILAIIVIRSRFTLAAMPRMDWIAIDDTTVVYSWLLAALAGLVLIGSIVSTLLTRENLTVAAARLDEAAGLKERLSTGLHCASSQDPFAQAVVRDAEGWAARVTVGKHMPYDVPRSINSAGVMIVAALLMLWLFPNIDMAGAHEERQEQLAKRSQAERAKAIINPQLEEQLEKLREKHPSLKDNIDAVDPLQDASLETPLNVRSEAIKKVEQLKANIQQQRDEGKASIADALRKMMRPLATQKSDTPVGKLAEGLAKGDFQAAQKALEDLKLKLSKAPVTEAEKKQIEALKKELDGSSDKLAQHATEQRAIENEHKKAGRNKDDVKRALEALAKKDMDQLKQQLADKGMDQQKVEQMMKKLQQQQQAMQMMKQMGQGMAQAGANQDGTGQLSDSGAQGLSAAGDQLSDMESLQQELDQLGASLADLQNLQNQLGKACGQCNGTGMQGNNACPGCQGSGMGQGQGQGQNQQAQGGMGQLGRGQGGIAPEEETDVKTVRRRTDVKTKPGSIISQQWVDGEQFKGGVSREFSEAMIAAEREITDAIAREDIPRNYHESIGKYFERNRELVAPNGTPTPAEDSDTSP